MIHRPAPAEYQGFFARYVNLVPEGDVLHLLEQQLERLQTLLSGLSEQKGEQGYGPGKWTAKEVLGHMTDTERIMAYRALCFSRGEKQALPGFDENAYVANADFNKRNLPDLLRDHQVVRQSTLALFRSFTPEMNTRTGTASSNTLSVQALAFVIAGHELHHLYILRDRYGL
jgi:hypothetical protein